MVFFGYHLSGGLGSLTFPYTWRRVLYILFYLIVTKLYITGVTPLYLLFYLLFINRLYVTYSHIAVCSHSL